MVARNHRGCMGKICAVFGHSSIKITRELEEKIFIVIEQLINQGCESFYFGGFGIFDELCHKVVSQLKATYTHIKRIFCLSDPRHLRTSKRPLWLKSENYEDFVYLNLDFDWWYRRIYFRNCAMIDKSDIVLFYVEKRENSGAYKTFKYAMKRKKKIINLCNTK